MLHDHRLRDAALLLPILAVLLFLPAVLELMSGGLLPFGLPSLPAFIFAAWLALIIAGAWLARRLSRSAQEDPAAGKPRT